MIDARWLRAGAALLLAVPSFSFASGCNTEPAESEPTGEATMLLQEADTERLRLLAWNVDGVASDEGVDGQCAALRDRADGFDVVVVSGLYSESARLRWAENLASLFPYALIDMDGPGIDLEDSGLLVLSALPFVPTRSPYPNLETTQTGTVKIWGPPVFLDQVEQNGGVQAYARFDEFRSGMGADATKAKGAVLFHVQSGSRRYDIVGTDMQVEEKADDLDETIVREEQAEDIVQLLVDRISPDNDDEAIVAGSMGVDAFKWTGSQGVDLDGPISLSREYAQLIWGDLANAPFFDAWRTTSSMDAGATFFGNDYSASYGRSDYILVRGAGYHTPGATTWQDGAAYQLSPHDRSCPSWTRTVLHDTSSRHAGIAIEMGPKSEHCTPQSAAVGRTDGISTMHNLAGPGSSAWFYFATPGTYTLGLGEGEEDAGLVYEVFDEQNLSSGVGPMPRSERIIERTGAACGQETDCSFKTRKFSSGTGGFFVRVFDPKGRTHGMFRFFSLLHDCSSEETACELVPGAAPFAPSMPTTGDFIGHFTFNTMPTVNPTKPQTLDFEVRANGNIDVAVSRAGVPLRSVGGTSTSPVSLSFDEANVTEYLVKIARASNAVTYDVAGNTNLTWVHASPQRPNFPFPSVATQSGVLKLVLIQEGGWDVDDEEIRATVEADGVRVGRFFRNDMDQFEALDMSFPSPHEGGFGFVKQCLVTIDELDGEGINDPVDDTTGERALVTASGGGAKRVSENYDLYVPGTQSRGPTVQLHYTVSKGRLD